MRPRGVAPGHGTRPDLHGNRFLVVKLGVIFILIPQLFLCSKFTKINTHHFQNQRSLLFFRG